MIQLPLVCLAATAAFFVLAIPAAASPPQPMTFGWDYFPVRQSPVEQQQTPGCPDPFNNDPACAVINSTGQLGYGSFGGWRFGCAWDVDDNAQFSAAGPLAAGGAAAVTVCQVMESLVVPDYLSSCYYDWQNAPGCARPVAASVYSDSARLEVTLCFQPGPCFRPQPVYEPAERLYHYWACARAVYPYQSPLDVTIPGSNGGHGVITDETLTIRNPTDRTVKTNAAVLDQLGWAQGGGWCAQQGTDANADPDLVFRWTVSG